jgi:hypothetical protein
MEGRTEDIHHSGPTSHLAGKFAPRGGTCFFIGGFDTLGSRGLEEGGQGLHLVPGSAVLENKNSKIKIKHTYVHELDSSNVMPAVWSSELEDPGSKTHHFSMSMYRYI